MEPWKLYWILIGFSFQIADLILLTQAFLFGNLDT